MTVIISSQRKLGYSAHILTPTSRQRTVDAYQASELLRLSAISEINPFLLQSSIRQEPRSDSMRLLNHRDATIKTRDDCSVVSASSELQALMNDVLKTVSLQIKQATINIYTTDS